jgi:hypothetical protein
MKLRPVGAEVFHADVQAEGHTDRQTDRPNMTKLMAAFRN